MSVFQFKHFSIKQAASAMKIGTDSVLLGCFSEPSDARRILDIGAGTGLLALMMAQRSDAVIDAVEIDDAAYEEALFNFENSAWKNRLQLYHSPVQEFPHHHTYDLIISNPPYFRAAQNMKIEDEQRSKARHDKDLPFEILCNEVLSRLNEKGNFWMILPAKEADVFKEIATEKSLHLLHEIKIKPKPAKPFNRVIMSFGKQPADPKRASFTIYHDNNDPSPAYISLTKDFYLWKDHSDHPDLKW